MAKATKVNLRELRKALGRWVNLAVYTGTRIIITNAGLSVAQITRLQGAGTVQPHPPQPRGSRAKPRTMSPVVDVGQGMVSKTLASADKLAQKLFKKPGKKAGKRTYPPPKGPVRQADVPEVAT